MYSEKIYESILKILDNLGIEYRVDIYKGFIILPHQTIARDFIPITGSVRIAVDNEDYTIVVSLEHFGISNLAATSEFLMRLNGILKFDKFLIDYDNLSVMGITCVRNNENSVLKEDLVSEISRIFGVLGDIYELLLKININVITPEMAIYQLEKLL
ncbi:MAG: hypothetical protein IJV72_00665 [Clostridia bacterium]|nr:hypothetical protein [Clostridia bacterium]